MKGKILLKSIDYFNQNGFERTAIRSLADSLFISHGHLRYYYPTMKNIAETAISELKIEIDSIKVGRSWEQYNFYEEHHKYFFYLFEIMFKYKFLYLEASFIKKLIPDFSDYILKQEEDIKKQVLLLVKTFDKMDFTRDSVNNEAIEMSSELSSFYCMQWLHSLPVNTNLSTKQIINKNIVKLDWFVNILLNKKGLKYCNIEN